MLSQEQTSFYRREGYLLVEDVLSKEELHQADQIIDDFVQRSRSVSQSGGHDDISGFFISPIIQKRGLLKIHTYMCTDQTFREG